jgi:hypothetical protein
MLERFLLVDSPASRFMILQGVMGRKISALLFDADFSAGLRERPGDPLLLRTTGTPGASASRINSR